MLLRTKELPDLDATDIGKLRQRWDGPLPGTLAGHTAAEAGGCSWRSLHCPEKVAELRRSTM